MRFQAIATRQDRNHHHKNEIKYTPVFHVAKLAFFADDFVTKAV